MHEPIPPRTIPHFIEGVRSPSGVGEGVVIADPNTGIPALRVPIASSDDVGRAVRSAKGSQADWARTPLTHRVRILRAFKDLLAKDAERIIHVISSETGKTHDESRQEIDRGVQTIEFACGVVHFLKGSVSVNLSGPTEYMSLRQPLGVVAGIVPYNFPLMVPTWMFPAALVCGNAFILKPSEKAPSLALMIGELLGDAGLPKGAFTVLQGDARTSRALIHHPDVAGLSFVGSSDGARDVYLAATQAGKRVQALGGAKNHAVILPDAPLDEIADGIIDAAFGSAGERCMSIATVVAVGDIGDAIARTLAARMSGLRVRPSHDADADMGPLISADHLRRIRDYIAAGVQEGGTLVVDGRETSVPRGGFFIGPTLIDHVAPDMSVYTDEVFGPVLCLVRVENLDAAITLINRNRYGNGAVIFTRDPRAALRFRNRVSAGMVGINVAVPAPAALYPFGGWKDSLYGDSAMNGEEGFRFYTREKVVSTHW